MSRKQYGLPYLGSKNRQADAILEALPAGETFYDLFGGGAAMTDAALQSGKYSKVIYNDYDPLVVEYVRKAFNGEYKDRYKEWISREDWKARKDSDPYIKYCWSFGNTGSSYLYSKAIEPYKKAIHYAVVFEDYTLLEEDYADLLDDEVLQKAKAITGEDRWNERRLMINKIISKDKVERYKKNYTEHPNLAQGKQVHEMSVVQAIETQRGCLQNAQNHNKTRQLEGGRISSLEQAARITSKDSSRVESLERSRVERVERVEAVEIFNKSYDEIELGDPATSVIFADPPYRNTDCKSYSGWTDEDYDRFYNYMRHLRDLGYKVFITEQIMPEDFKIVKSIARYCTSSPTNKAADGKRGMINDNIYTLE